MLKAQKGKSIFLQLFDISQQIAISSLQGYFSAAENIESQDGLKIWNIQKLNILPRSIEHRTEHGLNILSTADVVMKCQLWFFCCPLNWVQNLLSDGWSSLEQGYSIAIQMHPDHKKYWLKEMFPAFYVHLIENLVGKPQRQLVRSFSSMKISPSIFRPVLSRGETVDSCCSQCSDDVRWCQLLMWNASHRPRTRKQEDHCLSLFSTNQNFHKALTILFTNKQTCLVNLYYLYINPTLTCPFCSQIQQFNQKV